MEDAARRKQSNEDYAETKRLEAIELQRLDAESSAEPDSGLVRWSDDEMGQMANVTDADIQAAANSASPKLRDLNTAQPDSE